MEHPVHRLFEESHCLNQCDESDGLDDYWYQVDWDPFNKTIRYYRPLSAPKKSQPHNVVDQRKGKLSTLLEIPAIFSSDHDALSAKFTKGFKKQIKQIQVTMRGPYPKPKEEPINLALGLDVHTFDLLYEMFGDELMWSLKTVHRIGKDSIICIPKIKCDHFGDFLANECILKICKNSSLRHDHRETYIRDDSRYRCRLTKNRKSKKMLYLSAKNETTNLRNMKRAGLNCPEVIFRKQNIIVMSLVGKNGYPASTLGDAYMTSEEFALAYDQVTSGMRTLYQKANLVHCDLSEDNILWHNGQCYFIDVAQSVEPDSHKDVFNFLFNDCTSISNFFSKKGLTDIMYPDELFKYIVGYDFRDRINLKPLRSGKP